MKTKKIITVLFPIFLIAIITLLSSSNILKFSQIDLKGLYIISIVLLFPILFLLQGIISIINNTNIFLSITVSIIGFIALTIKELNNDIFIYILFYLFAEVLGYLITKFIVKYKKNKQ